VHHPVPPQNWVSRFKRGDFSTCNAPRPGRPKTVTTPEIIDQIQQTAGFRLKSIAEQLGISHERVGPINYEDWDMRKLSAKWVPKFLNVDQKRKRYQPFVVLKKLNTSYLHFRQCYCVVNSYKPRYVHQYIYTSDVSKSPTCLGASLV
jgi:hypothetical protein